MEVAQEAQARRRGPNDPRHAHRDAREGTHGGRLAARSQVVVDPGDSGHQTEGCEVLRACGDEEIIWVVFI